MRRFLLATASLAVIIALVAFAVGYLPQLFSTSLTFRVVDSASGGWVWDATITLQDKEIRSFFQSDSGAVNFTFTRLKPGKAVLRVSAPSYETAEIGVTLRLGRNALAVPVKMVGYELPGLNHFALIASSEASAISLQIRPVDGSGQAIVNHPCVPLWVGARVSAESANGRLAQVETPTGPGRGQVLYVGKLDWRWDPAPASAFRYTAAVPLARLGPAPPPYLVIDSLIIVPDPRKISAAEVDGLMQKAPAFSNMSELTAYLDARLAGSRFRYFVSTLWNVPSRAQ